MMNVRLRERYLLVDDQAALGRDVATLLAAEEENLRLESRVTTPAPNNSAWKHQRASLSKRPRKKR